ncbi:penicillin-binding transpeptidase domain-containing protein [Paenibacillus sp.]|uniref:penicillin-binding transpeptidase domain-containing protein n=1 Tax=Paenibacillus sp. TaxID=58172 RepID=UPI002D692480|nr:penicillin-binding transpeptidase domain-containing protein [Paenibacillus sp.]HZG83935.1 penicillin-binding transpeptidase domain-containing protein [Paenibacillus sp.]
MRRHRIFHVLLAFAAAFALLAGRLLWLQRGPLGAGAAAEAAAMSVRQRAQGVTLDAGRGHIVDRRGVPFTGAVVEGLLLFPGGADRTPATEREQLAAALGVPAARLLDEWRRVRAPSWWTPDGPAANRPAPLTAAQREAIRRLRLVGAGVASSVQRYPGRRLAAHAVGFVAEQPDRLAATYGDRLQAGRLSLATPIGAAGLELAFDRLLQAQEATRIVAYADGAGHPLDGLGVRTTGERSPYYPLRLVTTLDAEAQQAAEEAADAAGLREGAVVVLDAATADIVAMVSRPAFPDALGPRAGDAWANRAIRAFPPGSVMKSFVAAVALEEGAAHPGETFDCDGTYGKYGLTCWKKGGHGRLTLEEALAESCNVAFAEIGERLDGATLERYAEALGLVGPVGWQGASSVDGAPLRQLPEEQPGRLFAGAPRAADGGVLAQTAIGQRDARWTPLSAANWMVTLLHGGAAASPRAASELQFADGTAADRYALKRLADPSAPLSGATVRALRGMLEGVVADGTGAALRKSAWPLAGKSGTAEAAAEGRAVVHQWFVGYGPANAPRYAVAVLAANRPPESPNQATALFGAVMDALAALP